MYPIPVSKTKIIPPRRRDELLTRKRLLDMLFDALDKKLVLVSAPAGYGKTSLLIDLYHKNEYKSCWLSLDELDSEPQRFISYLLASIAEQFPGFGNQTAAVLSGLTSIEDEMERLAVMLVNEAYEMIHEHFVLILDDFHILEGAQPIYNFLNRFIQLVDDNCHVVISSRTLTTLYDLPLMVAREQVNGLSFSDLAFRAEEIQALVLQNNHIRISDEEAGKLIEATEGWITGLQFSGRDVSNPISNIGIGLFDYLGQQVLDRQKPEMREFLMRTSIMEEFDSELCEAVLAPSYKEKQDWDVYIKSIIQNNLFALPVGAEGRSLRYHHLFRDYLRTRFHKEHKDEANPILVRLSQAYETMGEWGKAHFIIKQLGDMEALAGVIERTSHNNLHRILPTIESWMNDLPPSILRNHPGILSVNGAMKLMKGDFQGGFAQLDRAIEAFRQAGDVSKLAMALIRRSAGYRFTGDYPTSIRDAEEAIHLVEGVDEFQSLYAEALHTQGLNLVRFGQTRLALNLFEKSYETVVRLDEKLSIPDLLQEIATTYSNLGDYAEAEKTYLKALDIWKQEANVWAQCSLFNNLGYLYHQSGEYEKAAQAYEEGILCSRRSGHTRSEALISIGLGDLYAELQDFEIAEQNYRHAETMLQERRDQFLLFSLQIGKANLFLFQSELILAEKQVADIEDFLKQGQSHYENGMLEFVRGKLLLRQKKYKDAVSALEKAELHFEHDGREFELVSVCVWLAAAYCANKNMEAAANKILKAVGEHKKISQIVIVSVGQTQLWLDGLQKNATAGRVVRELFLQAERVWKRFPAIRRELHRQARIVEVPDPRLFIQAFGRSLVRVRGKVLSSSDWQTQSVRDLFFFFLSQSRPLTKEQIAEAFWPEIDDPAKIRLRFKNELYRLRRAVGQETIRFDNAVYSFNHTLDYEYDVESFESYVSKAKSAKVTEEQVDFYHKAVELVHGPYLDDMYFDWVLMDRERLNQIYLNALLSLAELYQKQAMLEEALVMCQRAVECDSGLEAAYRLSMQIYHRLRDRQAVMRTYQACVEALKQNFDLSPSKETKNLYHKLIS
ncbi:MAG: tetratricopeptide repeat protein [Anaerolineales bacterium]